MSKIENALNAIHGGISGSQYRYALERIYFVEKMIESELSDYARGVAFGLKLARHIFDDVEDFQEVDGKLQEIRIPDTVELHDLVFECKDLKSKK